MNVTFNPGFRPISYNKQSQVQQRTQQQQQYPAFGRYTKITVPKDSGEVQDIIDAIGCQAVKHTEENVKDLNNAYINCKAYLKDILEDAFPIWGLKPPKLG